MVLVGQLQRCGGTLLVQLFDGHSQIYTHPPELYWGKPEKWNWPNFDVRGDTSPRHYYYLLYQAWVTNRAAKRSLDLGKVSAPQRFPFNFNVGIHRKTFFYLSHKACVSTRRDVLNCYLKAFYSAWLDYENSTGRKKFHVAFIPRISMHQDSVERFFEDYPDGFLVHMFRHPAAWWASARKHHKQYEKIGSLKLWEASTKSGIKMKTKYGKRVICVSFEGLVTDTKMSMRNICRYLGLEWEDTLLRPTFNSIPVSANTSFDKKPPGSVSLDVVEIYNKYLAPKEIVEINREYLPLYLKASDYCVNKQSDSSS
ncbi:MAG: sulfotransferase [Candidatus Hodarchaeota archaeon]